MSDSSTVCWSTVEANVPPPVQVADCLITIVCCKLGCAQSELLLRSCFAGISPTLIGFTHLAPDWQDQIWLKSGFRFTGISLNEPIKFRGWLSRIATNLFYDELRKRKRVSSPLSLDARSVEDGEMDWEIAGDNPSPDEELTTQDFMSNCRGNCRFTRGVPHYNCAREIEGMPYEEIAEITGVSWEL